MASAPGVYLLTGPDELLLHRAADELLAELDPTGATEVTDLRASEVDEAGLPDLHTESLFGDPRALVIREAQALPAAVTKGLAADLEAGTAPATTVVLLASGTGKLQRLAKQVSELGGRRDLAPPKPWDDEGWAKLVADEFARHGREVTDDAVEALLSHAGTEAAVVVEKVTQVAAAAPAGRVTDEQVDSLVSGHGSKGSFAVADAMCDRQPGRAVELLRGCLESGDDPVMVLGALAYRLRSLVAVAGGLQPADAGLKLSSGQLRRLKAIRGNFGPGELTAAYRTLADADAAIKGSEVPPEFVLERAVAAVATTAEEGEPATTGAG
jgi:DNA polymerase-3 subunit delta